MNRNKLPFIVFRPIYSLLKMQMTGDNKRKIKKKKTTNNLFLGKKVFFR